MRHKLIHIAYIYVFSLVCVATLLSCSKQERSDHEDGTELSLMMNSAQSKGYVVDGNFFDTPYENLHEGGATTPRTMYVSAYLYPQSGVQENYLVGEKFERFSDERWHHFPAIYWPVGGELSFLALSSLQSLEGAAWCPWNCSESVTVVVDSTFTQDDLLFASLERSSMSVTTNMQFFHSQPWIQFSISAASGHEEEYIFRGVRLNTIYKTGELTISNNDGEPQMEWSFRRSVKRSCLMDDVHNVVDSLVRGDTLYMDMLIPEQEKTSYTILYSLSTSPDMVQEKSFELPREKWIAGRRYIYDVVFGN